MKLFSPDSELEKAQPSGLCFRTVDDARNFARQSVKESRRWLAEGNVAQHYIEGKACVVVKVSFEGTKFDLLCARIPSSIADGKVVDHSISEGFIAYGTHSQWFDDPVIWRISYVVKASENVIPPQDMA